MKPYSKIIVAIDFTPSCRNALKEAVRLATENKASLTALHVMNESLVNELKQSLSIDQATVRAEWQERLRKFVHEVELGELQVEIEVRIGHPFAELAEASQGHSVDLLIMGAKGSRDEPNRVGVIAAKCVRKAPVDVFLVRDDGLGPFKHLVTCVDFSPNSGRAVERAVQLARHDGATLSCLNVYQSPVAVSLDYGGMAPVMPPVIPDEGLMDVLKQQLEDFVKPFRALAPEVIITTTVLERMNIREAILEHVKDTRADMVVLGTRGKSGLRELLIGTTAENVVSHAPCSILAVKPEALIDASA